MKVLVCAKMGRPRDTRLAILLTFIFGFEVTSGQFMNFNGNKLTIAPNNSIVCNSDLECIEETCNEGRVCRRFGSQFVQYGIMTCDENSDTPYCDNGLCSKTPRIGCEPMPFLCPADGVFPDPVNCSRYHICADGVATTNQCPSKNVYDHLTGGCKYQKKAANCVSFNCAGREGQPVVYSQDQRIYGICILGTALIFGRCNDYEIYDIDQERCVRNCKAGGTQPADPGPNSCRKYVLCAEASPKKYEPVEMSCACNEGYDEVENRCTANATCLANIIGPLCPKGDDDGWENGNDDKGENDEAGKDTSTEAGTTSNGDNSGNPDGDNIIADDNDDGNLENGNDTEKESDADSAAPPDNNNDGNLVDGNDNPNSGNVTNSDSTQPSLITDNPEGDDNDDGNLVNESDNGGDSNPGEIHSEPPPVINNPEDNDNVKSDEEDSANGDSNVDENSNDNANANGDKDINDGDPVNNNNDDNQESGNGDNDVNGNVDQNDSGNVNSDKSEATTEEPKPSPKLVESFIRVIIDWIMRLIVGQSPSSTTNGNN